MSVVIYDDKFNEILETDTLEEAREWVRLLEKEYNRVYCIYNLRRKRRKL